MKFGIYCDSHPLQGRSYHHSYLQLFCFHINSCNQGHLVPSTFAFPAEAIIYRPLSSHVIVPCLPIIPRVQNFLPIWPRFTRIPVICTEKAGLSVMAVQRQWYLLRRGAGGLHRSRLWFEKIDPMGLQVQNVLLNSLLVGRS